MKQILEYAMARTSSLVETLANLVEVESPSTEPQAVSRFGDLIAARLEQLGATVKLISHEGSGNVVSGRWGKGEKPVMVLGHLDTVWPLGTLAQRPVRIEEGRLYGPGSFDMKGGLAVALHALEAIQALNLTSQRPVTFLFTPLEEVGGKWYRAFLEEEARQAQAVLVLEPALTGGAVKTARKGVGKIILRARGRAAHAGLAPWKGVNAITELAHHVLKVQELNDRDRGVSVNVGLIRGGLRPNVVADLAEAEIDIRFPTLERGQELVTFLYQLKPVLEGASLEATGGISAPPLERTPSVVELYQRARELAWGLGFELRESSSGGASEGCYTAAVGTPTLDGLGPDGEGAHAVNENVLISSLPKRTALLAGLLLTV